MSRLLRLTFALLFYGATSQAQAPGKIEGVWKVTEVVVTGANASTNSSPLPSQYIFTKGHYSLITVNGTQPRTALEPAKDPANLTDAEKLARYAHWNAFSANSGTYTVSGTTITSRPLVAKNETVMTGPPAVREFKIEGNTLWLIAKSAAGAPVSETRTKLTRVE